MNKKGFTLIELLAVIVILGIITLIAIPSISNIIKNSKKSVAEANAKTFLNEVEKYATMHELDPDVYKVDLKNKTITIDGKTFKVNNNGTIEDITDNLKMSGTLPTSGEVTIGPNGKVTSASDIIYGNYTVDFSDGDYTVKLYDPSAKKYVVGEEVKLKVGSDTSSIWYIIKDNGDDVTMLKKTRALLDGTTTTYVYDSRSGISYPNSQIKTKIDTYGQNLLGDKLISISMLSRSQLSDLGCSLTDNTCPNSLSFLTAASFYWLYDVSSGQNQWAIKTKIEAIGCYVAHDVRPVITVSKTIIQDAS